MTWLEAVPVAFLALAVLYIPGGMLAAAAGARQLLLAIASPVVTVAVLALAAIMFGSAGVPWNAQTVIATFVVLTIVTAVSRRFTTKTWIPATSSTVRRTVSPAFILGVALAATLITVQLVVAYGLPDNVSQTYDASFHLNGVKFIIDTANGSSLHVTGLILPPGRSTFYPAAWHDLVSVVAMLAPWADLVSVANMTNLVIAAVVWPLGAISVVRLLLPRSRSALLIAGAAAAAFPAFPLGMLDYGVLYSYFLSVALLPAGLALGISLFGLVDRRFLGAVTYQILSLLCAIVAMSLSQPAVVLGLGLFGLIGLAVVIFRAIRQSNYVLSKLLWIVGFVVVVGAYALVWRRAGSFGFDATWRPYGSALEVLLDTFAFSRAGRPVAIVIAVLLAIGIVVAIRRGWWWLVSMWGIAALLFFFSGALPDGDLRNIALGVFYKDAPRLEAFLVLPAFVVVVIGANALWGGIAHNTRNLPNSPRLAIASLSMLAFILTSQATSMVSAVDRAAQSYWLDDTSRILDADERELIQRLPEEVPDDAVIVGNPWTGTAWAMAIADRQVLNPHFHTSNAADVVLINKELNKAGVDPTVCEALDDTGVKYVLDFGADTFPGRDYPVKTWRGFEGLLNLRNSGIVKEIDREGDAVLYRVVACHS